MRQKIKKILFITRPLSPPWDEASKNFAYNLAREVARNNSDLEIHLMTKDILPNLPPNIIQHPVYTSSQNDFGFWQKIKMLWFLIWQAGKFHTIHLLFTPTKLNSLILKYIFKIFAAQAKVIQTVATLREDLFSDAEIKQMLFGDKIVTYSQYAKNKLQQLSFNNVQKIYPGIDLQNFRHKEKNKELLQEFNFQTDDFIINFTGEYTRLEAIDDVISAFIEISRQISAAKLSLAVRVKNEKDAAKKRKIIAQLKKKGLLQKVSFHDDGNYEMSDIYNLCDISVFPVRHMKGKFDVPLAVIEVMACEKPVILSDIPVLKEFANEKNSLTIEAGEVSELTQAILLLYKDKSKRTYLGTHARTYVKDNFNLSKAGKEYTAIYKSL